MTSQSVEGNRFDATILGYIANILLVIGMVTVFQSGFAGAYPLGMILLVAGLVGSIAALIWKRTHPQKIVEQMTVLGMFVGILGMLQPWDIKLYEYGFIVLGLSTIIFIVITHFPEPKTDE